MESKFSTLEVKFEKKLEEMDKKISSLSRGGPSSTNRDLECPVCGETVRRPMRLKQCGQGHIICDSCLARKISYNPRTGQECHSCRGPITGRPNALEKMARLI